MRSIIGPIGFFLRLERNAALRGMKPMQQCSAKHTQFYPRLDLFGHLVADVERDSFNGLSHVYNFSIRFYNYHIAVFNTGGSDEPPACSYLQFMFWMMANASFILSIAAAQLSSTFVVSAVPTWSSPMPWDCSFCQ